MLNQHDPRLAAANLIVNEGGLCGPTCTFNLLAAVELETQVPIRTSLDPATEFWNFYNEVKQTDIRKGTSEIILAEYLSRRMSAAGFTDSKVGVMSTRKGHSSSSVLKNLSDPTRSHIIMVVGTTNEGIEKGHFLIVKAVDRESNKVLVIDPNAPHVTIELSHYPAQHDMSGGLILNDKYFEQYYGYQIPRIKAVISLQKSKSTLGL